MYQRFSTKSPTGTNNLCGSNIKKARLLKDHKYSQQRHGADLDKNMIQRIEAGQRYVTDIELQIFANVLNVSVEDLLRQ